MLSLAKFWNSNKGLLLFLFLMLFFRSAIADWYHVPSGSMQPTIQIGDRILVNKLAYDWKIPLTDINLQRQSEPKRGDVIVFDSEKSGQRLIKRVIGIPGDEIEMVNHQLVVNSHSVNLTFLNRESRVDVNQNTQTVNFVFSESFKLTKFEDMREDAKSSNSHLIKTKSAIGYQNSYSSFPTVLVPKDHLLVLGDNRDNSADFRVIGLVPRSELIGRAERVIISFDKNNIICREWGDILLSCDDIEL